MTTNIAIIGAGCAGLGAAAAFMETNADLAVTLIDANDWIGGRARTSTVPGLPVDLGPQFIQDPAINPWTKIMAGLPGYDHLKVAPIAMEERYRVQLPDDSWVTALRPGGVGRMHEELYEQFELAAKLDNCPIMTGNAPAFCKGQQDLRLALGASSLGAIAESAEPWQYVASDQARQDSFEGEEGNIYVPGGLGKLVETYGRMLLSTHSKRLSFANDTIVSVDSSSQDQVELTGARLPGANYDYCIVTVPAGTIGDIKFIPSLTQEMTQANSFIALGSYKKVAFRPTGYPQADPDVIETGREYFIYDRENDGVWQYFRLPTEECILICVTAGDFARSLDDKDDFEVADSIIKLLGKAHPGGNFQPRLDAVVVTNWTRTPHIGGAYSYTRYDSKLGFDDPRPLAARPQLATAFRRIHFAGEATWPKAYGTIHGAYESGRRAAKDILELLG
jgi:monoamine oxidase